MDGHPSARCVMLGGGGHAAVLIDCLLACELPAPLGILDPDPSCWGNTVFGVPVLGGDELLGELRCRGADCFAVGVGSTGSSDLRRRLFELGLRHRLRPLSIRHPSAVVSRFATIGAGSQLLPGCLVNARAVVGENVIVNSGALVEHDCRVESHAHIAPRAILCGGVGVGAGAHLGAGAVVRQCLTIGGRAVVAAGAVVVKDVPEGVTVAGVPARVLEARSVAGR